MPIGCVFCFEQDATSPDAPERLQVEDSTVIVEEDEM